MRRIIGVAIGIGLCFPGALALQTVSNELGVYQDMSLTDALLMIIIVLACALLFGQALRVASRRRSAAIVRRAAPSSPLPQAAAPAPAASADRCNQDRCRT
jgi:hypothetical protein